LQDGLEVGQIGIGVINDQGFVGDHGEPSFNFEYWAAESCAGFRRGQQVPPRWGR